MKKSKVIISLISIYMLFSCTSSSSLNESSSIGNTSSSTSETISTQDRTLLYNCNFEMDLSTYIEKDVVYQYENEFGKGFIQTNLIYINCDFSFYDNYYLDTSFSLSVNEKEVTNITLFNEQNQITFKIEDPNWSNMY